MEILLTVMIGIGLSAACGFRIFVPFLIISIASLSGHLTLADSFGWIGTIPALVAFGIATILEITAYFIPWFDNVLDTIATPVAVIAGIILMASVITGMSPLLKWALAIIAGGSIAGSIQGLTGITRLTSSTTTAGLANPAVATIELGSSASLATMSVFVPVLACLIVIFLIILSIKIIKNKFNLISKSTH